MTTEINLGNLVIPIIKPQKGTDYYTEAEKQELISIVTNNVNSMILPQEQTRQENEATRQSNEETRQSQENTRQSNEVSRQTAESARVEAENLRQSNESSRISAEQTRVETFNTKMQAVDTAIGGIHTSQDAYDQNAQNKTEAFNTNATNKMNAYNENASEKIAEYDEHVHDYETELANKVDKVQGKGLSTNDYDNTEKGKVSANTEARHTHSNKSVLDGTTASYTTEEKAKLAELENYDDTGLREDIEQNATNIEELKQENEDLKKNQLTNTPTPATSHYLQDSADSRFRKFIPIGRTTQESTTGANLISSENIDTTIAGVTYKSQNDGTILANGTKYGGNYSNFTNNTVTLETDTYSSRIFLLDGTIKKDENDYKPEIYLINQDDNTKSYSISEIGNPGRTKNIEAGTYFIRIALWNDNIVFTNAKIGLMLVKGSSIPDEFERYTGGEPAPNPNYPYAIKNTGDNGSVNEKVQNKNILVNYGYGKIPSVSTGELVNTYGYSSDFTEIDNTKEWIWSYKTTTTGSRYVLYYDKDKNYLGYKTNTNIISSSNYWEQTKYIKLRMDTSEGTTSDWQVEQSQVATSYVPHSEQTLSFPLAQGQKFYEGSHPDDDEKVHHVRKQVKLTGNETWHVENGCYILSSCTDVKKNDTLDKIIVISTHFPGSTTNWRDNIINGTVAKVRGSNNQIGFKLLDTFATLEEFKVFLANNNVIIEYLLEEEQTEDFTEGQKTAWKEWKKARTYKNITHISSEDETPANVEIEYVRDINTIDDRITALEAKVDLLEE